MERVQKVLAAAGVSSRRAAEQLILDGRVTVNGEVIAQLGTKVDPARDVVAVDGTPIQPPAPRTLMLNKPAGYLTTRSDPHARDTVMSLVPEIPGLHPIGRLDKDTTGLLLLTNDGALTNALTHPRHRVKKTYHVWVQEVPTERAARVLMTGVEIELSLVDGEGWPALVNDKVLERVDDPAFTQELGRFNLEINVLP
ncbi:MAG TPA: pseudouridine synthase, partial [Armatimonadota bacterium]|nr:pseudouridine synthase [Armatimonadota bacterium]